MDVLSHSHAGPRIPGELQNMVIRHLRGDRRAVSRCSLVSRGWSSVSRRHLFRELHIQGCAGETFFTSFCDFINKRPAVLGHVVRLELYGRSRVPLVSQSGHFSRSLQHIRSQTLSQILQALPKLAELHLNVVKFDRDGEDEGDASLGRFRLSVLEIDISGYLATDTDDFLHILRLFSHISVLRFTAIAFDIVSSDTHEGILTQIEQPELGPLDEVTQSWIFNLLRNSRSVDGLKSIKVEALYIEEELENLGRLLRKVGPRVQDLSLSMWTLSRTTLSVRIAQMLNIEACTSLKTFEAVVEYDVANGDAALSRKLHLDAWTAHIELLSRTPKSLEQLRLRFT